MSELTIRVDDPARPELVKLLSDHIGEMRSVSPPESTHTLDIEQLKTPDITLWSGSINDQVVGCAAIKELAPRHGEIKSMRTLPEFRGQGIARKLLNHLIRVAHERDYERLSLETGSMAFFNPAQQLYGSAGFEICEPFANYLPDPNSIFMTKKLMG